MKGAFIGDTIGMPYEFNNTNNEDFFPLLSDDATFTDDSVLTAAIAFALCKIHDDEENYRTDEQKVRAFEEALATYTIAFPHRGYGGHFKEWAYSHIGNEGGHIPAYGSAGNGSAMRVSPVAWYAKTIEECEHLAKLTALPTHDDEDGIAGAQATAGAIFLALHGGSKADIKAYVEKYYALPSDYYTYKKTYRWHSLCDGTVQAALYAFLASDSFEDTIRKSIAIGGDSDTIAAIAGPIAEAYYGLPEDLWKRVSYRFCRTKDKELIRNVEEIYKIHEENETEKQKED